MDLEVKLVRTLEDALCQISSKFIGSRVKIYWCRRHKAKTCDLIAQVYPTSAPSLNTATLDADCERKLICEVINKSKSWCIPLEKCEIVSTPLLQIHVWLNRTVMAAVVLKNIEKQQCKGLSEKRNLSQLPKMQSLIYASTLNVRDKSCSLTDLRSLIIMELINRLLESNGGSCQISCDSGCDPMFVNNCKAAVSSRLTQPVKQRGLQNDLKYNEIDLVGPADCLGHITHLHDQMALSAILVTSQHANVQNAAFKTAWDVTKDHKGSPSFIKLIHGPVIWREVNPTCTNAEQLYRLQIDALRNSFLHKYRELNDVEGDQCSEDLALMFEHLADLSIKFHILGCSTSKEVRMNIMKSDSGGTFVMYNYSRICVLLSKFEVLALLPPIEEVDFSLLKKEEEWRLVMLLAKCPNLINCISSELQDLNSDSSISPSFHKIIEFMSELGHQISVYYSHVRVLMSALHLQDVMFARIWLLKCVKRILEDIFYLLNVTPVKQM